MKMDNRDESQGFNYVYSAKQQQEIEKIRRKYAAPEEDKMEQLRRLDRSVTEKATAVSLVVGILGALLLGLGMSCAMVFEGVWFIPGIAIGIAGIAILSLAYPLYTRTLKKEREKAAPEIMRLSDELMK